MNNHRGWIGLAMALAALFSCACMLFSQGAGQTGNNEEDMAGFEETLAAELEEALEDGEPEQMTPETLPEEGGGQPGPQAGWKQVEGLGGFFRLDVPQDWAESGDDDHQEFCAGNPAEGCIAVDLRIKYASAESLLTDYLAGLQENVTGYQEAGQEAVTVGGLNGVRADVSYTWREKPERSFVIGLVYNRVGLLISEFAAPERFEERQVDFEQALDSFTWVEFEDAPPYVEWGVYEAGPLSFSFPKGTWIEGSIAEIARDHEGAYAAVVDQLAVAGNPPRVHMILYPSETALYHSTARQSGFAINWLNEVHSIWAAPDDHQSLGHEMTHVISSHTIGEPQEALLGEGLAVCLDQRGYDYRQVGQELVENQRWLTFDQLAGDRWFEQDPEVAYAQSGSVVCYLFEAYGAEKVKAIYQQDLASGLGLLGTSLQQLQEDWLGWAQGR